MLPCADALAVHCVVDGLMQLRDSSLRDFIRLLRGSTLIGVLANICQQLALHFRLMIAVVCQVKFRKFMYFPKPKTDAVARHGSIRSYRSSDRQNLPIDEFHCHAMDLLEFFTLNNSNKLPAIGLGTFQGEEGNSKVKEAVKLALKLGYRHIDGANAYGNEKEIGEAIKESGISREEIYVTSKLSVPFFQAT